MKRYIVPVLLFLAGFEGTTYIHAATENVSLSQEMAGLIHLCTLKEVFSFVQDINHFPPEIAAKLNNIFDLSAVLEKDTSKIVSPLHREYYKKVLAIAENHYDIGFSQDGLNELKTISARSEYVANFLETYQSSDQFARLTEQEQLLITDVKEELEDVIALIQAIR